MTTRHRRGRTSLVADSRAPAAPAAMTTWIARKRDGGALDDGALASIVAGAADGSLPDYQLAALLMAIVWRGLDRRELLTFTRAMLASGARLDLSAVDGPKVDKHSTGGVGDKISLVLAPLVAACGVASPMLAGRGLGHTGGTIDKLEAIPGWRAELPPAALVRLLDRAGFFIAAQSPRIAPADRVLYALRDATGTVESIPLIAASIVSKKVAGGADALVLDVKSGRGAFLSGRGQAPALARAIVGLARRLGLPATALLTDMDQPLGHAIGNACEVVEALAVLRGDGPRDVRELSLRLGVEMLLAGRAAADPEQARTRLERALASGAALERFIRGVRLQGGDARALEQPGRLPRARRQLVLRAPRAGFVIDLHPRLVAQAAMALGAGRRRKEESVDPGVGVTLHACRGEPVAAGEPLATLWYNDTARLAPARTALLAAYRLGPAPPPRRPLVVRRISAGSSRSP